MGIRLDKPMQKLIGALVVTGILVAAHGQEVGDNADETANSNINHGNQASLRGLTNLDVTRDADPFKRVPRDRSPYVNDYVYQPPLVPHKIRGYEITTNANKCLSCHSFKRAPDTGATKISVTHYVTREGAVLSDVSPRRYFCLQCHVTQADTVLLIENDFERVDSLK